MKTEHEQLVELCVKMGSSATQAEVMARQLAKRADQIVSERGLSRVQAMQYLLEVLVRGRNGEGPEPLKNKAE